MNLQEQILEILKDGKPLKGREIALAIATRFGVNVDKSEVNSTLYRNLNGRVHQNSLYQWTLLTASNELQTAPKKKFAQTNLSRLANYYLDCISKDMNNEVSVFASSKFNPDYSQLESLPFRDNGNMRVENHLINKVRNSQNALTLKLGYPLLIRSFMGKDRNYYVKAEPIFLFSLNLDLALQHGIVKLEEDDPVVNSKAMEGITGINSSSELLTEIVQLYDELGINNDPEDKPSLEELFLRLQQLKPEWQWNENLNIHNIAKTPISQLSKTGIYNSAAIFPAEKSKYTIGLEKDLKDLASAPEEDYNKSVLGSLLSNSIKPSVLNEQVLLEPIELNEEQREATRKGLSSELTVITGPPGTGKSQVVTSLIVNAIYQGKTVLFASKNNKAVDVVNERVNALSDRQVMLRLGAKFQTTLASYLSGLLTANPCKDEENRYKEAKEIHERLLAEISTIKKRQENLINIRNAVDQLELGLEELRDIVGSEFFAFCENLPIGYFIDLADNIKLFREKLDRANKTKQSFFTKLFWQFSRKERFAQASTNFEQAKPIFTQVSIAVPKVALEESTISVYEKYLTELEVRGDHAKKIKNYFDALHGLANEEDLFALSIKEKRCTDSIVDNSVDLWGYWLKLLPNRLTQSDRKIIGDYVAVLNLIIAAENTNQVLDRSIWPKYYSFLPKIAHILSCWAVTSLSARGRVPFTSGFFDLVIIDEASQCDIASAIPLLYRAKRAVIIGDDKQLTHISSINEMQDVHLLEKYGLTSDFMSWSYAATSLFRLSASKVNAENIIALRDHHRSHGDIISYSNKHFYDSSLRIATKYGKLKSIANEPAVRWIDAKGKCARPESGGAVNEKEAEVIVAELIRLVSNGYQGTIGVVTPFRAQFLKIQDKVNQNKDLSDRLLAREFLCDTVHKFQGDEKDLIIFSPVVSEGITDGSISFLKRTGNLFNVAITRARAILLVVGDSKACLNSGITHYKGFVEYTNALKEARVSTKQISENDFGPKYPQLNTKTFISDWEKRMYEALHKAGIKTVPQYQVDQYSLDLAFFDGDRKLNIEVDGEKYHRSWDGELLKRDQLRNKRLIELGWDVQRFWVYEIRDNMEQCIQKIREWKG